MSADDQAFLDVLSAVPNDVRKYTNEIADAVDSHLSHLSHALRNHMPSSWLRTPPTPSPSKTVVPPTLYSNLQVFAKKNRNILIGIAVFLGVTTYVVHRRRKAYGRKRRAKRAPSGARVEVVIIAGSPNEPITRSLSLDLERRGFIVYVVCNTIEEEVLVQNEGRADIKPLMLDIVDPTSTRASLERFSLFFTTPQHAFPNSKPHHLQLSSLLIVPSTNYPSAPIPSTSLSPQTWSDLLNTRLLYPIALIHTFLPLLPQSKIIVITPSIISSLKGAPYHAPESTIVTALETFTETLRQELAVMELPIPVTNIKMGYFNIEGLVPHYHQQISSHSRIVPGSKPAGLSKGSSLRELHNAVFDVMEETNQTSKWALWRRSSVVRVGQGSVAYSFAGKVFPRGLVGWMMGLGNSAEDEDGYVRVYE